MPSENKNCLLCSGPSLKIEENLNKCLNCELVFKDSCLRPPPSKEKKRYMEHNNDVSDMGYLDYLGRLFDLGGVKQGVFLDFGSGPAKGLEALVKTRGLDCVVDSYDPFFFPIELNPEGYDLVFASECFEHFYNPFQTISNLIFHMKGALCVGTHLHNKDTDWKSWWYTNDPTHVVFYSEKTMFWLADRFGLKVCSWSARHFLLTKNTLPFLN